MGYLGLDQTEVKDDNMFQRMFWPSDHAGETDQLGKQGFWVCLAIAVLSLITLFVQGHPFLAIFSALFYWLGGVGVREHSQPAAMLVAIAYVMNLLASLAIGVFPGILTLAAAVLLIANIRGTFIAAKWARMGDPEAMPERRHETFSDKVVDQMPRKIWPAMKVPFFVLAGLYLALNLLGTLLLVMKAPHR